MGSLIGWDGQRAGPVARRERPATEDDRTLRRDRDRLVIDELRKGRHTKARVAAMFGITRQTVYEIEERYFGPRPNPLRRWTRPDMRRRDRASA
jgi:DNA invertase Pin-like site-specific DNA recombinase